MASSALLRRVLALPPALRRSIYTTSTPTPTPDIFDVVTIGGGPVGLSFVSALRSHPSTQHLKIALVDSQDLSASRPASGGDGYSNRCSSLTRRSLGFLRRIGAWDWVVEERTQGYHGIEVWDGVSGSKVRFDAVGQGGGWWDAVVDWTTGTVATMCENNNVLSALLQHLHHQTSTGGAPFTMLDRTKVETIQLGPEPPDDTSPDLSQWPIVETTHGSLAARLLVGADGANSPHGIVATLHLDHHFHPDDHRAAYQRFLPTGPIALLPLPGNRASLVWSTTPHHAATLKALPPEDFVAAVNAAFRLMPVDINYMLTSPHPPRPSGELSWRESATSPSSTGLPPTLPRVVAVQPNTTASFPLRMRHADTYTAHRVALIGDAPTPSTPSPAKSLAAHLAYGVDHGMDIGTCWTLDTYNSDRWAANHAMLGVCDKLQRLYSAEAGPVVWGRSVGLEVVDRLGPLKGMLMGAASGRA
ncbi:Ubiquinone biosynthesis monooxygenase COQ6, mitochondrial [Teratosphaeria destructans]|uniref:Ubiquinone biosynthesis monooxygenase COQ6, mitochondrial n=1 Tax=Teratosphaeria destructans TaxID=418781 RepID=A0A9W7VYV5_9PEZI|nr:Ubiquinone biosynthesis monooxygenase COQ6, mitochondrial [Teratosphaeria destructans]